MGELSLHEKVQEFVRDALGLHPREVKGLLVDEGVISVECYAHTFTGRRAHDEAGDAVTYFKTYTL